MTSVKAAAVCTLFAALLFAAACDGQFTFDAVATDCVSGQPLPGVMAVLKLDTGTRQEESHQRTKETGRLRFFMDEGPAARATLTLERSGYRTRSWRFERQPTDRGARFCLERIPKE